MKETFKGWANVKSMSIDAVSNLILTGRKAHETKPDMWMWKYMGSLNQSMNILDFGCGFGRNTFGMALYSPQWNIIGYDNDEMLSKVQEFYFINYKEDMPFNVQFLSEWDKIKTRKFDIIFCCIVLQHIMECYIAQYVEDFMTMTSCLIVSGRRFNDDVGKKSTWSILEENGLIPVEFYKENLKIEYSSDGNPNDHNTAIYRW